MKQFILGIFLLCPLLAFAWQPHCGFVVVSQSTKISSGSIGNLILLNCRSINPGLPNYNWLAAQCSRYKASGSTVLIEGDSSKVECTQLASKHILLYTHDDTYFSSRYSTPARLTGLWPSVMYFPVDFITP